ncbi:MAG: TonB family protein, partial [Myxococcota bacterium]
SAPAPPAVAAAPPSAAPGPSVEDLLDRYKALLLARIAAQKRYPAMARRRGIEGDVTLRLRIDAAGDLAGVETLGRAPLVLAKQARTAAQKAAPFPPPPGGEFAIDFVLRFSLTD